MTTGLIARLENEAQLAFILAHEIAHFTEKHVLKSYIENNKIIAGKGEFRSVSESEKTNLLSVYSQEKEFDADKIGLELYLNTDYSELEVNTALDLLLLSDLPLLSEKFDREFFNDDYLVIPNSYFPKTISQVEPRDGDFDDSLVISLGFQTTIYEIARF